MSKIYDALENRDLNSGKAGTPLSQMPTMPRAGQTNIQLYGMEAEMNTLYQTITAALPDRNHRSVLLMGSRPKEGASTIAKELARTVASRLDKKVLLVDCEGNFDEFAYQGVDPSVKLEDILENKMPADKIICPVNGTNLCILPFFIWADSPRVQTSHDENGHQFWDALNQRFDLVIIDYPQEMFANGPVITSMVDGVIIVVEAEKTRWQVALSLKEKIINNGGNILGLVFNKRQYYIPQYIYDRL